MLSKLQRMKLMLLRATMRELDGSLTDLDQDSGLVLAWSKVWLAVKEIGECCWRSREECIGDVVGEAGGVVDDAGTETVGGGVGEAGRGGVVGVVGDAGGEAVGASFAKQGAGVVRVVRLVVVCQRTATAVVKIVFSYLKKRAVAVSCCLNRSPK